MMRDYCEQLFLYVKFLTREITLTKTQGNCRTNTLPVFVVVSI